MSNFTFPKWRAVRQAARTDIFQLCKILHYDDVCPEVHGEMVKMLQKFVGGVDGGEFDCRGGNGFKINRLEYKPAIPMWKLGGSPRKSLIMAPRGSLKTTVCDIAFIIQWILNYPDVRILLSTATGDQAKKIVGAVEDQFRMNEDLRFFFPDFCPKSKNVKEWGTQDGFICPARKAILKEPTLSVVTVGAVVAGGHYDVHINDDLVDKENVRTPDQITTVIQHFGSLGPLVETNPLPPPKEHDVGWVYVIGTPYDFSDLYGLIRDSESKLSDEKRTWAILAQSAKKPDGTLMWPNRITQRMLDDIENDPTKGPEHLASQYYCNPIPSKGGLVDDIKQIKFMPHAIIMELLPRLRLHCTIDLHGMEPGRKGQDNDYTVMTVAGFGPDGRPYIVEIRRGRFTPDEVIENVFELHVRYPQMVDFKIEKDAHARVLLPFLRREMERRMKFPMVTPIRRDNRTSKQQRIKGLQPWFKNGDIRFNNELACKLDLINEIMRFPKYAHDDILDTLADQLQNRDGALNYDVVPTMRASSGGVVNPIPRFLGFAEGGRAVYAGEVQPDDSKCDPMTGL